MGVVRPVRLSHVRDGVCDAVQRRNRAEGACGRCNYRNMERRADKGGAADTVCMDSSKAIACAIGALRELIVADREREKRGGVLI